MKDLFLNTDLTLGPCRRAISDRIPKITSVTWRESARKSGIAQERFIFNLSRRDYERDFGRDYGEYPLADDTYAELLDRLAGRQFTAVPPALRQNIAAFYAAAPDRMSGKHERKRVGKIRSQLAALKNVER